jgi:hypothetical protein
MTRDLISDYREPDQYWGLSLSLERKKQLSECERE